MEFADIEQLISIITDASITELAISTDNPRTSIRLTKPSSSVHRKPIRKKTGASKEPSAAASESIGSAPALPAVQITAPMVGIFHATGCVIKLGMPVTKGQVVGSIESMKLMNDVVSSCDGVVLEILVEDGMPVEYGQGLFTLEIDNSAS